MTLVSSFTLVNIQQARLEQYPEPKTLLVLLKSLIS
jgi:hypothetical protein